jgi:O-antigen ligase
MDRILVTLFLSSYIIFEATNNHKTFQDTKIVSNFVVIFSVYLLSQVLFSEFIDDSFERTQQIFISLSLALMAVVYEIEITKGRFTTTFIYLTTAAITITLISIYTTGLLSEKTLMESVIHYFKNIRVFNHLQTISFLTLGLLLLLTRGRKNKILVVILLLLNALLLFYLGARGSTVSILVALSFLYATNINSKRVKKNIFTIGAVLVIGYGLVLLYSLFFQTAGISQHMIKHNIDSGRLPIYYTILPFFADLQHVLQAVGFSTTDIAATQFLHPHNIFLYVFLGGGLFGLTIFIIRIVQYVYKLSKRYQTTNKLTEKYLISILLAIFTHSLVSGIYITPLASTLILGVFIALGQHRRKESLESNGTLPNILNILLSVSIVATALYFLKVTMEQKKEFTYEESNTTKTFRPGIMLYGDKIFDYRGHN